MSSLLEGQGPITCEQSPFQCPHIFLTRGASSSLLLTGTRFAFNLAVSLLSIYLSIYLALFCRCIEDCNLYRWFSCFFFLTAFCCCRCDGSLLLFIILTTLLFSSIQRSICLSSFLT